MHIQQVAFGTPQFDEMLNLRDQLLRKPLGLKFEVADIAKEYDSIHLGCFSDYGELIGCLVLLPLTDSEIKMRQVAVQVSWQRRGIGKLLVDESEAVASQLGYKVMVLHARDKAIKFYTRLGYKKIGKPFEEVSIKHYKMQKKL